MPKRLNRLLAQLEAGSITWEQALVAVTALPTAWLTKEWKEQHEKLIGNKYIMPAKIAALNNAATQVLAGTDLDWFFRRLMQLGM